MDGFTIGLWLVLINAVVFLAAACITLDNPFKMGILVSVALANCGVFFLAVLLTSDSPLSALSSLASHLAPLVVVALCITAFVLVQTGIPTRHRR